MKLRILIIAVVVNLLLSGCRSVTPDKLHINSYTPDENWRSTYPERVGVERSVISDFLDKVDSRDIELHNLIIIKSGYLITNAELPGYNSDNFHDIASVTKGIMALLIGIAIDEKFIENEEVYVSDILEGFSNLKGVKIKHLLSMTSGIECINKVTDDTPFAETSLLNMMLSKEWDKYISSLKMTDSPGKVFSYNSINFHILSMLISEVYGSSAGDFAMEYLFKPLGIKEYKWEKDYSDNSYGWGNLKLKSPDLARIAYLVSNRGIWGDKRVVSESWIDKVLTKKAETDSNPFFSLNYGYGWFIPRGINNNYFAALGRGGQTIFIFPREDMIVQTFGNYDIGEILFLVPKLVKGSSSTIENDIWNSYYGDWTLDENIFNIKTFALRNHENDYKELILESDLFNLKVLLSPTCDVHLSKNIFNNEHVETSWSIIDKKSISVKINEIENINTFYINVTEDMSLNISEHQLIPKGYKIVLKKVKKNIE